ncbi:MAG: hypothetical protein J6B77_04655 [Clostridia bacterium]|nr:hypothetical protein [Clostridia bacterium]
MKQYLLPESGNFYKANMHMHTVVSDGKMTPEETKQWFLDHGYSIVAFTDHEVLVPQNELSDENFLAITSYEISVNDRWPGGFQHERCYHLNLYAKDKNATTSSVFSSRYIFVERSKQYVTEECAAIDYRRNYSVEAINDIIKKATADGFLVCYNHPVWSNQRYPDYSGLKGLWGVEVYNGGCNCGGYVENTQAFDDLLHENEPLFPICSDDAHAPGGCGRGWIQVKADALDYDTVMQALKRGDFYASTGPEIYELTIEDGMVHATFSDAVDVYVCTERRNTRAKHTSEDAPMNEVTFNLNDIITDAENAPCVRYRPWFRFEIVDRSGKTAYTRAYFLDELKKA